MRIALLVIALALSGCTHFGAEKGDLKITYWDFHPGGNAVNAEGKVADLGSFKTDRSTEGAAESIEATGEAISDIVNPISVIE